MEKQIVDVEAVEKILGIGFASSQLLIRALTHRSYLNIDPGTKDSEAFEYLGDKVLNTIIARYLFFHGTEYSHEERLWASRWLPSNKALSMAGQGLGIAPHIRRDPAAHWDNKIIADVMEAIVGAIMIDSGFANATMFVQYQLLPMLEKIIREKDFTKPQEVTAVRRGLGKRAREKRIHLAKILKEAALPTPSYYLLGPGRRGHVVIVVADGRIIGTGWDEQIPSAFVKAVDDALGRYREGALSRVPYNFIGRSDFLHSEEIDPRITTLLYLSPTFQALEARRQERILREISSSQIRGHHMNMDDFKISELSDGD